MKNSKSGSPSSSVLNGNKRSLKPGIKSIIIVALTAIILFGIGYSIYSNQSSNNLTYVEVLTTSKQLMAEKKYKQAYKLLEENKEKDALENNLEFYVLISRAAYLSGNKDQAKKYATKASELYKATAVKDPAYGYILQSILSGTYIDNPYQQNQGGNQTVPKEQVDDPDFQG